MRKNSLFGKRIITYSLFKISGRNVEAFINILHINNIEIFNIKRIDEKNLILSIKNSQVEKFFAINKELCYTIKRIKNYGALYPLSKLLSNVFLCIGIVLFFLISYITNNYIFEIEFVGSGNIYKSQLEEQLFDCGVFRFASFPSADKKKEIENELAQNPNILFASIKKSGNYLIVNTVASGKKNNPKKEELKQLVSKCNGIIEDIKVYSGTQIVSVGDCVKEGDILVDGRKIIDDKEYSCDVKASVIIKCEVCYDIYMKEDSEDFALIFATEQFGGEVINYDVIKEQKNEGFLYKIKLYYRIKYTVD